MRDYAEQIERLRECASNNHEVHSKCGAYLSGVCAKTRDIRMQDAADAIEELLAAVPQWISVEDELPEIERSVLLFNGAVHIGWRVDGKRFRFLSERFPDHPTHWMPIPEGPEEVE